MLRQTWKNRFINFKDAYEEAALSSVQDFKWHKAFKDGKEAVEDEERSEPEQMCLGNVVFISM